MSHSPEDSFFKAAPVERLHLVGNLVGSTALKQIDAGQELVWQERRVLAGRLEEGLDFTQIARKVAQRSPKGVRRAFVFPLIKRLGARNFTGVPRIALANGLLDMGEPEDGPIVIRKRREILELLSYGASVGEIAQATGISTTQVRRHIHTLLGELEAKNEEQLVMRGFKTGNISLSESYLPTAED